MNTHAPHRARAGSAPRATAVGLGAAACGALLVATWAAVARPGALAGSVAPDPSAATSEDGVSSGAAPAARGPSQGDGRASADLAGATSPPGGPAPAPRSPVAGAPSAEDLDRPLRARGGPHARLRDAWAARARADAEAFERDVRTLLADGTADAEAAAALTAAGDARLACADALLAEAISLPDVERPRAGSLPRFALAELARRAARGAGARAELERAAFDRAELAPALRGVAAAELAGLADSALALRMLDRIALERDPTVRDSALAALRSRPQDELVRARLEQWFGPAPARDRADGEDPSSP